MEDRKTTKRSLPAWLLVVLIGRSPRRTLVRVAVLIVLAFLVRGYVLIPIKIMGPSMLPTYPNGGINFVYGLAYFRSPPKRGDVVAIRTSGKSVMYMKRVIGLPGETVQFHNGRALINGVPLDEPYVVFDCDWESPPKTLGPNSYYVVGDNRSMPELDHTEGVASTERIVGKILLCKNLFVSSARRP
jgi:signal peptidase I